MGNGVPSLTSYPPGKSVDDGIEAQLCSHIYTSVDQVARVVAGYPPGTQSAKVDIESAYQICIPAYLSAPCRLPTAGHLMGWKSVHRSNAAF